MLSRMGYLPALELLASNESVIIDKNTLEHGVFYGQVESVQILLKCWLKRENVTNWNGLMKLGIINLKIIDEWIKETGEFEGMQRFLIDLKNGCFKQQDFHLFMTKIDQTHTNQSEKEIAAKFEQCAKLWCIVDVLSKY